MSTIKVAADSVFDYHMKEIELYQTQNQNQNPFCRHGTICTMEFGTLVICHLGFYYLQMHIADSINIAFSKNKKFII